MQRTSATSSLALVFLLPLNVSYFQAPWQLHLDETLLTKLVDTSSLAPHTGASDIGHASCNEARIPPPASPRSVKTAKVSYSSHCWSVRVFLVTKDAAFKAKQPRRDRVTRTYNVLPRFTISCGHFST